MADLTHQSNGSLPSPAQLALAMAIVKHKPADLSIRDYILQIRSYIMTAKDPDFNPVSSQPGKFFDSVSFWQQAYEQSEAEQSKLLDRIFELEQRNTALLAKTQKGDVGKEEQLPESSKRKANPKNADATATARKRAKTQMPSQGGIGSLGVQGALSSVFDRMKYVEEFTAPFMRHFYTLQTTLQKRPNRSNVVQAAINLSKAAADALVNSVQEKNISAGRSKTTTLQHKDPEVISMVSGVESALPMLYQALGKVSTLEEKTFDAGLVTYHIVCLYETAMKMLGQHCKDRSAQLLATTTNGKLAKKQNARSKRAQRKTDDEVAGQITRLLGTMILLLDLTRAEHQNILEGALFILLNRVGRFLCLFVFKELQLRPDLRVDPAQLPLPQGLKDVSLNEQSICAAKMESKHLIWVLERALAHLETSTSSPSSREFTSKIKGRLQSTLLQAMYGTDDECFQEALRRSVAPDILEFDRLRSCAQVPEQTVADWFTQEVWRLVGWELVVKKEQET
ncbi:uncharacterized protein ACHE_41272S [Aspergillus chevalieri]|uniref:Uncharacterized protein n=1 Tax=Aspergillus chevalieri TaxID=182096 RepID=A0A7R7VQ07_ASPCH|nr:uncharacterized protein ACHE_41272S [Aspergillus chevalieri]BCR88708.1 hypothetical protein ACHE_41272S [Aspergillus chevalieri]